MGVEQLRYHTDNASLTSTHSRTHFEKAPAKLKIRIRVRRHSYCVWGESIKPNILLSSCLWPTCRRGEVNQNQQLLSKAWKQQSQVLEEWKSVHLQADLLLSDCLWGNHHRIIAPKQLLT